jgi:hypothetical protein
MEHPITPPLELVQQWASDSPIQANDENWAYELYIAHQAARWGADQELEACVQHVRDHQWGFVGRSNGTKVHTAVDLQLARRPKPPSLNSIALQMLSTIERDAHYLPEITDTIRRALEALPND